MMRVGGVRQDLIDSVLFVVADLTSDAGWRYAVDGCEYVHHVASPFPVSQPRHEDELIVPARDGTLRLLRFAREAQVKRVIMTSSFAAIAYGHAHTERAFTEDDWGNADGHVSPYIKSKILAERSAWDFISREGGATELTVVNPVGIFGPALGTDYSASIQLVKQMLDGAVPACPRLFFSVVDVRDVADLHVRCMIHSEARNQRFLAASGDVMSMTEVALLLRDRLGDIAHRVPTRTLPNWLLWIVSFWNATAAQLLPELDQIRPANSEKAKRILQWSPRTREDTIIATAQSLTQLRSRSQDVTK